MNDAPTPLDVVREYKPEPVPDDVAIAHKYSDVYKNGFTWTEALKDGETSEPSGNMDCHTGAFTTGRDW